MVKFTEPHVGFRKTCNPRHKHWLKDSSNNISLDLLIRGFWVHFLTESWKCCNVFIHIVSFKAIQCKNVNTSLSALNIFFPSVFFKRKNRTNRRIEFTPSLLNWTCCFQLRVVRMDGKSKSSCDCIIKAREQVYNPASKKRKGTVTLSKKTPKSTEHVLCFHCIIHDNSATYTVVILPFTVTVTH